MADYRGGISLSQAHTSEDSSSEHSPGTLPTLSTLACGSGPANNIRSTITTVDQHHHRNQIQSLVEPSARKPRGRPPGSKNKPKPPIVITRESESAMKPVVLEISAGSDVVDTIVDFARRQRAAGLSVVSASGSVSNVTLRHPVSHAPALSLHGPFNILSLTGTFFGSSSFPWSSPSSSSLTKPPAASCSSSPCGSPSCSLSSCSWSLYSCFGITLAANQGQVFGGIVAGKVTAASQVVVVGATFLNPAFHRLPCGITDHHQTGGGEADHHQHHQEGRPAAGNTSTHHHGSVGGGGASGESSNAGMSMTVYGVASPAPLNCLTTPPHDVMPWGPTSRPPY